MPKHAEVVGKLPGGKERVQLAGLDDSRLLPAEVAGDDVADREVVAAALRHLTDGEGGHGVTHLDGAAVGRALEPGALSGVDGDPQHAAPDLAVRQVRQVHGLQLEVRGLEMLGGHR